MTDRLMVFKDAQKYLSVSRSTLYSLIRERKIPALKLGGQWRFRKERLIKWLDNQEDLRMRSKKRRG